MIATQEVVCPKCGERSEKRTVLTSRNVESFTSKPQLSTCPKCGSELERAAGSEWKLREAGRPASR
jgi:hypothetical protein